MSEGNAVQRAFDRFGKDADFEKKSGSWYRRGDEVISISNLQKSQYGPHNQRLLPLIERGDFDRGSALDG